MARVTVIWFFTWFCIQHTYGRCTRNMHFVLFSCVNKFWCSLIFSSWFRVVAPRTFVGKNNVFLNLVVSIFFIFFNMMVTRMVSLIYLYLFTRVVIPYCHIPVVEFYGDFHIKAHGIEICYRGFLLVDLPFELGIYHLWIQFTEFILFDVNFNVLWTKNFNEDSRSNTMTIT